MVLSIFVPIVKFCGVTILRNMDVKKARNTIIIAKITLFDQDQNISIY